MQLAENSTSSINKICCHGTAVQSHIINILLQFLGLGNIQFSGYVLPLPAVGPIPN